MYAYLALSRDRSRSYVCLEITPSFWRKISAVQFCIYQLKILKPPGVHSYKTFANRGLIGSFLTPPQTLHLGLDLRAASN